MVYQRDVFAMRGALLMGLTLALSACGNNQSPSDRISVNSGSRIQSAALQEQILVRDESGKAIVDAKIMIGARENVPFPGNILTTDAKGSVGVPASWTTSQPVTIDATGFVRATYFNRTAGSLTFTMKRAFTPGRFELKGETKGFGSLPKDGFIDFGLVIPALTRLQAATLQISALTSPEIDTLTVFGQSAEVPSNITFPKQTETYGFPLTVEKPIYRVYMPQPGQQSIVATHAKFPFKTVIDELRGGKGILDVVNHFEFRAYSIHDVAFTQPTQTKDLAVNGSPLSASIPFKAPSFDPALTLLAAHLGSNNGLFFVTDLKSMTPNEQRSLTAPQGASTSGMVLAGLKRDANVTVGPKAEELTAVLLPANRSQAFDFLGMVKSPELRQRTLVLDPPKSITGVAPALTYAVLSVVELIEKGNGKGSTKYERKTAQWELYAPDWATSVELPEMPQAIQRTKTPPGGMTDKESNWKLTSETSRWEVLFGGQPSSAAVDIAGPASFDKVSHVTRSAVDVP